MKKVEIINILEQNGYFPDENKPFILIPDSQNASLKDEKSNVYEITMIDGKKYRVSEKEIIGGKKCGNLWIKEIVLLEE